MIKEIKFFQLILAIVLHQSLMSQNPSALYQNWVESQTNNTTPILPTFSYAGYHNGENELPKVLTQQVYDITDYGAIANDEISDKSALIAAISAAESNPNGGVVFFPKGRFIINDATTDDISEVIRISKSNIVLKGSGSGIDGTELYQKDNTEHPDMATKPWACPYLIQFTNGENSSNDFITNVTANASRETFTVEVSNTSNILVGQWIELYVENNDSNFVDEELAPYSTSDFFEPNNLKIVNNGVKVREVHKIVSKTANTITFKEPLHKDIDANYNWKINNFKALEEVGIQDLTYIGGYTYNFLHHRAPQELYPNEETNGPHAYLSDSGWSGIQFNHVVNGWIKNIEFKAMSRGADFKFSANCSAINNTYTGNPGHNFISTNAATGCFIGSNLDKTSGVWHGTGVSGASIANVLWRNEHPNNGNSGLEIHASQPRSTLFDACKGGMFFNQGGSSGSLPNHLKHLVLWNLDGTSYQQTNVKSWRPLSETKFTKFLMPIISGLKGFTMSTETNQYQVNESEGIHVDETSLYEKQLEYRLGYLPDWVNNTPKRKILYSEDFSKNITRGFTIKVINNGGHPDGTQLMKYVGDIPDLSDSNNLFYESTDREIYRIPNGTARNQKAISISGTKNNINYAVNAYAVFSTLNLSKTNTLRDNNDNFVYATFWTQRRYADGNIADITLEVSTDYSGSVLNANWTTLPLLSGKISNNSDNRNYVKGIVDLTYFANSSNGDNITLAIHYKGSNSSWSSSNRNGTLYISDLQFITQETEVIDYWSGKTDSNYTNAANWTEKAAPSGTTNTIKISSGSNNYPNTNSNLTAESIILEPGTSFIADAPISANITYQRNLVTPIETGNFNIDSLAGWHLVSSPVSNESFNSSWADANNIANGTGSHRGVANYINSVENNNWNYFSDTETPFNTGQGYSMKRSSTGKVSFSGTMNTNNITDIPITTGVTGYNLIGNPFTAYINATSFLQLAQNTNLLESEAIWLWNSETQNYEVKLSGDANPFKIAPGQGFFIKAASNGNLSFNTNMRSHQSTDTFLKSANTLFPEVTLNVTSDEIQRFTKIRYLDNVTKSFDNGFDGETFVRNTNKLDVFTHLLENSKGAKYQIQSIPNSDYENMVIPIGITSNNQREITFTVNTNNIPIGYNIYLEDRVDNIITNLSNENALYKTRVNTSETLGRFYLHMNTSDVLSTKTNDLSRIQVYKSGKYILKIIGLENDDANISIFNTLGSRVLFKKLNGLPNKEIKLPNLPLGVYFVKIKTKKREIKKKIIME